MGEISLTESFLTFRPSFEDLMNRLFSNFFDLTRPKAEKIESLNIEILLTPEEALQGGQARVLIPTLTPCPTCTGHGRVGTFECWHCTGKGAVVKEYPVMIHYPAGISNHVVEVSLDRFGIRNFYLTVCFRVGELEILSLYILSFLLYDIDIIFLPPSKKGMRKGIRCHF